MKPALEELLALYEDGVVDPEQEKTVVIAVRDCEEGTEAELEEAVGERLKALWKAAVKPEVCVRARGRVGMGGCVSRPKLEQNSHNMYA